VTKSVCSSGLSGLFGMTSSSLHETQCLQSLSPGLFQEGSGGGDRYNISFVSKLYIKILKLDLYKVFIKIYLESAENNRRFNPYGKNNPGKWASNSLSSSFTSSSCFFSFFSDPSTAFCCSTGVNWVDLLRHGNGSLTTSIKVEI